LPCRRLAVAVLRGVGRGREQLGDCSSSRRRYSLSPHSPNWPRHLRAGPPGVSAMLAARSTLRVVSPILLFLLLLVAGAVLLAGPRSAWADAGYALAFDGSTDYVSLARSSELFGGEGWTGAKTVSAWIKPTGASAPALPPTLGQMIIMADRPRLFGISRAVYQGGDRLWVMNADANGVDFVGIEFTPGEWVHVALVHDGLTL